MMKGILKYQAFDAALPNAFSGWLIHPIQKVNSSISYCLSADSTEWIARQKVSHPKIDGCEFEYELDTICRTDASGHLNCQSYAKLTAAKTPTIKVFLIDIDGTICEDIANEESERFPFAKVYEGAKEYLNKWYDDGNIITFFTARESKDKEPTEKWLHDHGFKFHRLVMDKPRIKDGQEYVWIDNRKVRAITYLGKWSDLIEMDAKIQVFS